MREIILIAGLPGSGKSVLGQAIAQQTGYLFLDDVSRKLDPDRDPGRQLALHSNEHGLVLADPLLCEKNAISNARALLATAFPNVPVRLICFENNPSQCLANVQARADGREVFGLIQSLSAGWRPEEISDGELRPVYSPSCKT